MTTSDNLMTTSHDNLNPAEKLGNDNHDNLFAYSEGYRANGWECVFRLSWLSWLS